MSVGGSPFVEPDDVARVAEMAAEASYISEIARKLVAVEWTWEDYSHTYAVQLVGKCAKVLAEDGRVEVVRPDYSSFGGQKEGSPTPQFSQSGPEVTDEWREYTIIYNADIEYSSVRRMYREYVDPDVGIDEKIEVADFLSRSGNVISKEAEEILYDTLRNHLSRYGEFEVSDYNQPTPDVYLQDFALDTGEEFEDGLVVEISTRWVNPIDSDYIGHKVNHALDYEQEYGEAVDVVIMAPRFTQQAVQQFFGSDLVNLRKLPRDADGYPVITDDPLNEQIDAMQSGEVGSQYPVVDSGREQLLDDMETVYRDYYAIGELTYRRQILGILRRLLGQP